MKIIKLEVIFELASWGFICNGLGQIRIIEGRGNHLDVFNLFEEVYLGLPHYRYLSLIRDSEYSARFCENLDWSVRSSIYVYEFKSLSSLMRGKLVDKISQNLLKFFISSNYFFDYFVKYFYPKLNINFSKRINPNNILFYITLNKGNIILSRRNEIVANVMEEEVDWVWTYFNRWTMKVTTRKSFGRRFRVILNMRSKERGFSYNMEGIIKYHYKLSGIKGLDIKLFNFLKLFSINPSPARLHELVGISSSSKEFGLKYYKTLALESTGMLNHSHNFYRVGNYGKIYNRYIADASVFKDSCNKKYPDVPLGVVKTALDYNIGNCHRDEFPKDEEIGETRLDDKKGIIIVVSDKEPEVGSAGYYFGHDELSKKYFENSIYMQKYRKSKEKKLPKKLQKALDGLKRARRDPFTGRLRPEIPDYLGYRRWNDPEEEDS